jgi:hypothetical protein
VCKLWLAALVIALTVGLSVGCQPVTGTPAETIATPSTSAVGETTVPAPTAIATGERLVPTPREGAAAKGTDRPTADPAGQGGGELPQQPPHGRERFGVGVPSAGGSIVDYPVERLGIGWYLSWWTDAAPPRPGGAAFWQMVHPSQEGYQPSAEAIRTAAIANPGSTWLIGNEPDVAWQDNVTPERYAELYGELYRLLKAADPTCRIAIGAVSQPTPLRLAYLDRVLAAYQRQYGGPMPVDLWNVHGFLLREEADAWGVGIPPGVDATAGTLYEIEDHDDLRMFQDQILSFRRWMAEQGYRSQPLVVSEYGILMPADYGFDERRVQAFMYATFDYLLTATDDEVGCPADGNRLVQWWAWYSLADTRYPAGNLFDPQTRALTPLGSAFARYEPPENVQNR